MTGTYSSVGDKGACLITEFVGSMEDGTCSIVDSVGSIIDRCDLLSTGLGTSVIIGTEFLDDVVVLGGDLLSRGATSRIIGIVSFILTSHNDD